MNKKSSYTKIAKLVALATIAVMGATVIATGGGGMPFEASAAGSCADGDSGWGLNLRTGNPLMCVTPKGGYYLP